MQLPELPPGCRVIWDTFIELHNARGATEAGPLALSWQDIHAWQQVRQVSLTGWEIDSLQAMDAVALKSLNKEPS